MPTQRTLAQLYAEHDGKVSDKWSSYIKEYERIFAPYRDQEITFLEIGVQNGGSLEIWAKFFPHARKVVGCEINEACRQLQFAEPKISLIIGDANSDQAESDLNALSPNYNVIIDDGSHLNADIVKSFARYFKYVKDDGIYVVEDLHSSYWEDFGGGVFHPYSAISFFKALTDVVNHEHWGDGQSNSRFLRRFAERYKISFDDLQLSHIGSVEFINSLCIVRKYAPATNLLGPRIISGEVADIWPGAKNVAGKLNEPRNQATNPFINRPEDLEAELLQRTEENLEINARLNGEEKISQQIEIIQTEIAHIARVSDQRQLEGLQEKCDALISLSHELIVQSNRLSLSVAGADALRRNEINDTLLKDIKEELEGLVVNEKTAVEEIIDEVNNLALQHKQTFDAHHLQLQTQKELFEARFSQEMARISIQLLELSNRDKSSRESVSELQSKLQLVEARLVTTTAEYEQARAKLTADIEKEKAKLQHQMAGKQRIFEAQANFLLRGYERDLKEARVRHDRREAQLTTQLISSQKKLDEVNAELIAQHHSFTQLLCSARNDHKSNLEEIRRLDRQVLIESQALLQVTTENCEILKQGFEERQGTLEQRILECGQVVSELEANASAQSAAAKNEARRISTLLEKEQAWHQQSEQALSNLRQRYEKDCQQIELDLRVIASVPWWQFLRKSKKVNLVYQKYLSNFSTIRFDATQAKLDTTELHTEQTKNSKSIASLSRDVVREDFIENEKPMNLQQLIAHEGTQFIRVAYLQVLGREPDTTGENYYVQRLKGGVSKVEILAQLRMSTEGKKFNAKISGIDHAVSEYKWMKLPLIGTFVKRRMKFQTDISTRLEGLDERIRILNHKMGAEFAELHRLIQASFAELKTAVTSSKTVDIESISSPAGAVVIETSKPIEVPNYFNSKWYIEQYPELDLQGLSPYEHFLKFGSEMGCHPAFDGDWYKAEYPDVAGTGIDPYEHFIANGKSEGRHPAFDTHWYIKQYGENFDGDAYEHYVSKGRDEGNYPAFDRSWYLAQYKDIASIKMDPHEHYSKYGRTEGRRPAYNSKDKPKYESRTKDFPVAYASEYQEEQVFAHMTTDIKAVTFFLPQFHRCDQNDRWWGEGFTEWTNTKSAKPNFPGHYQPREPHKDIGYYDLSDVATLRKQAVLAKAHGIYGFCFYHYWFSGARILEKPVDLLINNKDIDIKFMLCWANENWTKTWDGQESNILLEQKYLSDDPIKFITDISKYVKDSRYICVDGKPVIMVYKPQVIPRVKEVFQAWRTWWRENVGGEILIWCNRTNFEDTAVKSLADAVDAVVEFPPHVVQYEIDQTKIGFDTNGHFFDYQHFAEDIQRGTERTNNPAFKFYRSVMLGWDNSARRKKGWSVWYGFSLQVYYDWLKHTIKYTRDNFEKEERFVFINAWNEWAEGTYLEPDVKSGYASINTTSKALFDIPFKETSTIIKPVSPSKTAPGKIAVHAHLYFEDVAKELMDYLNRIPYPFDLFITTDTRFKVDKFSKLFKSGGRQQNLSVLRTPNIGRDIAPFMVEMSKEIGSYEFIGHFHTKKSTTVNWGDHWRHYLFDNLLGSKEIVAGIFSQFSADPKLGLVYPQNYPLIAPYADWGGLNSDCEKLLKEVGIDHSLPGRPDFPAGNMFWGRTSALKPLFDRKWSYEDFEPEEGQVGKTMAHAIERIWKYVAASKSFSTKEFFAVQPLVAAPAGRRRLSLFVHHDASGLISEADMYYLTQLKAISEDLVFISNSDLGAAQLGRLEALARKVVIRKNIGFDFGAWRDALNAVSWEKITTDYDEVIFANNSCFGPVFPISNMFAAMQKSGANFWAVTDFPDSPQSPRAEAVALKDHHIPAHLQSYFMVFDRKVVASSEFRAFWSTVVDVTDILDVIALYETQLTGILQRAGFKSGCYINEAGIIQGRNTHIPEFNTAYSDPISMIALGSPFIKKKISIYSSPHIAEVRELVKEFGHYESDLLAFPGLKNSEDRL